MPFSTNINLDCKKACPLTRMRFSLYMGLVSLIVLGMVINRSNTFQVKKLQKHSLSRLYLSSMPVYEEEGSDRLKKARLRLAEAQGIIPIGASDLPGANLNDLKAITTGSKVREISWRVAEPEVSYDPKKAASTLFNQPLRWITRNAQIFIPITFFAAKVLTDIALKTEEQNRGQRAIELLDIISSQSPALIKAGQALASRSDLLPKEYLDALQQLQDRCPPFPSDQAIAQLEEELGRPVDEVLEFDSFEPIAAASIGQVYKGYLKSNGAKVAVKVQRPRCEESIAIDLFVLRWYAARIESILRLLGRNVSLIAIIDDFGELIYREIDYRAEAVNAARFAELYASLPDIFVPKVYTDLSTSKILVMEWVDGARLTDEQGLAAMGLESSQFVDTLVQCSMRQLLENGFFHADPHAGNLLATPDGKLCYLDFGMVSYVEPGQRYSIIEAIVHMVNRDFDALAELYRRMGFIPMEVDSAPIVEALENALPDVLSASVGDFNFKKVIAKLGDVMYKFPFSLPPFYIAIIRCVGVLEGLALQMDEDFRIISDAYPFIASRLLTDPSDELQSALQQLLFKDGNLRWDRLQELLDEASSVNDYDIAQAVNQLVSYLISEQGESMRELMAVQMIEVFDQLETESVAFLLQTLTASRSAEGVQLLSSTIADSLLNGGGLGAFDRFADAVLLRVESTAEPSSSLLALGKSVKILRTSNGLSTEKLSAIARKVLREPVMQELLSRVISELSERFGVKMVRRLFGQSVGGKDRSQQQQQSVGRLFRRRSSRAESGAATA